MASYFVDLHRTMAKASLAYVGIGITSKDILGSNTFCLMVTNNLRLLLSEREAVNPEVLHALSKFFCCGKLAFWSLEHMESLWKDMTLITRLNVNELKEQFSMPTNMAIALKSVCNVVTRVLDMDPSPYPWLSFIQIAEMVVTFGKPQGRIQSNSFAFFGPWGCPSATVRSCMHTCPVIRR